MPWERHEHNDLSGQEGTESRGRGMGSDLREKAELELAIG
jgi:hypothetical protein